MKRTRPKTEPYSVTRSGPSHKRRKHPVRSEDDRLQDMVKAIKAADAKKKDQIRRRALGQHTASEKKNKQVFLGKDGKFKKGNPGKKKGQKNLVPGARAVKVSVRSLIEEVVRDNNKTIRSAILRGIRSGPRHSDRYLKLAAEYLDGKPVDTINVNSQYKQDELETAKRSLGQKLDKIFKTILENRKRQTSDAPAES